MSYSNTNNKSTSFPDPLAPAMEKLDKSYGLKYAKAIESHWGKIDDEAGAYQKRRKEFERNRDYANGTQDTTIYKQILNSLDPNNGDGTLLNLDWAPVPIIPKFVKIVVNKILSSEPYPNLQAVDPVSSSEKDAKKRKLELRIQNKDLYQSMSQSGVEMGEDPSNIPDTLEEAEIFLDTNVKTDAEIAAQVATNMTLSWNDFNDSTFRRCVNDLVTLGMSVVKRENDPNQGIVTNYVDPCDFVHSYTDDPNFKDLVYAGHAKTITIEELKRTAMGEFGEEEFEKIAKQVAGKYNNDSSVFGRKHYDNKRDRMAYGYDQYRIQILDFEFLSVDCMYFEDKENRFGNTNFFFKGEEYSAPKSSVFERKSHKMENATVYGGKYIVGTEYIYDYGLKTNVPKNIHDISKARLSYSVSATNLRRMMPKSMVGSITGFADQLQLTHLKIQQAVAKAKPDGLIVDIEGLDNVQLGRGGELQPLEIQDIYEQTGVFYYRSKNPEGGFQNPPVRPLDNTIRNINQLIGLYNHYLRMIRDATGINEAMDGTTPKGEDLVGVREQAIAAGNNAIYDVTHASMMLFKRVVEDIVKCLQIVPPESVLYKVYENAIGATNMAVVSSFSDLPMYNFGVMVRRQMDDKDRAYLEQNIQVALSQREIDIEDAIAVRQLRDVDQAERLLVVRRKKRIKQQMEQAQSNSQAQAQANIQATQAASQAKSQELQLKAQLDMQMEQMKAQFEAQRMQMEHEMRKEVEMIRAQATLGFRTEEQEFKEKLEVLKEDRKDERVDQQAEKQSKLISQRKGQRGELQESTNVNELLA
tara:strand:+ start:1432 stop:3861 length:2430 start_codon:yes stop_codon:yes gene_type:complete